MMRLQQNDLVHALMDEMRQAMADLEAGDVDHALEILGSRCRSSAPARELLEGLDSLAQRRVAVSLLRQAPPGLLHSESIAGPFQIACAAIAHALHSRPHELQSSELLTAALLASDYGASLVWNFDAKDQAS